MYLQGRSGKREVSMKICGFYLKLTLLFLLMGPPVFAAEVLPPPEGGVLPGFVLKVPDNLKQRQYLGLNDQGTFAVSEIHADVVIIEIFSMY